MTGVFGGAGRSSVPGSTRVRTPRGGGASRLGSRLPPNWGVDLSLILITLAGIVLVAVNLQAVLLFLVRAVYWLIRTLFWIALIVGLVVIAALVIRGRRRRRWW